MAAGHGYPVAGGEQGKIRAADADRDRIAGILGTAYSERPAVQAGVRCPPGQRLVRAHLRHLDHVVADCPRRRRLCRAPSAATMVTTPARTNGLAIASLACGLAQFAFGPLATIPAIVLGHMARNQIRRTGEQGAGLALAGLVLGWGAVILGIVLIAVGLAVAAGMHGAMPMR